MQSTEEKAATARLAEAADTRTTAALASRVEPMVAAALEVEITQSRLAVDLALLVSASLRSSTDENLRTN